MAIPLRPRQPGHGVPRKVRLGASMPEPKEIIEPTLELTPGHELADRSQGQLVGDPVLQHGPLRSVSQEPMLMLPGLERPIFLLVDEARAVVSGAVDEGPGDTNRTGANAQTFPIARLDPTNAVQHADIHPGGCEPFEGTGIAVPSADSGDRRRNLGTIGVCSLGHQDLAEFQAKRQAPECPLAPWGL